jgi:ADP-ribosylglycohydrolase
MYGALLGDMIGAPYEFDRGSKTKDFPLFSRYSEFTDDSVMTIAVAQALLDTPPDTTDNVFCENIVKSMQRWGRKYPDAGYGGIGLVRAFVPDPLDFQFLLFKRGREYGFFCPTAFHD